MKYNLLILIAILLLGVVKLPAAEWTVLFYMAADNGLNDYAIADINEMEAANISLNVNVIVQIDEWEYSQTPGAYRYKVHHDELPDQITSPIVQSLGEIDSGDYHSLIEFADWGFARYPSNHKLLVLWSHGNSWYKANAEKWICSDNTSNSAIEVWNGELKEAISNIPKVDILLFDACSMQAIEVISEVYRNCDYVIGSEDLVPATGFPYTEILNSIHGNTSVSSLAALIPSLYVNSYNPYQSQNPEAQPVPVSCSYAVCSKFPSFRQQLDSFASEWKSQAKQFIQIRDQLLNFNDMQADVDFNEFLVRTIEYTLPELTELGADAYYLQLAFQDAFPQQFNNEYSGIQAGYATIWFPSTGYIFGGLWQHYGYLDLAETAWSGFLNEFNGPDVIKPLKPNITGAHQELLYLYVNWMGAPDPGTLTYDVWVRNEQDQLVMIQNNISQASTDIFIFRQPMTVLIYANDEAGNISIPDSVVFYGQEPKTQAYFAPTPTKEIRNTKLHIYTQSNMYKFQWDIYDISGRRVFTKLFDYFDKSGDKSTMHTIEMGLYPELEKLTSGIYLSVITGEGVNLRTKLVIAK
jgi:hypothetical protein